jgi:hypothetical protein
MKIMKLIVIALIAIFFTSCNTGNISGNSDKPKTYEELKMELKQLEKINPNEYLSVTATINPNTVLIREAGFFRRAEYSTDGYNIEGIIKNSALVARFKDVVLTVTFMSKTETVIEEKDYVIYEFFEPNSTKSFSLHVYPPDATEKYNVTVKNAIAAD